MDDRPAELSNSFERCTQIVDREIGKGGGIARSRSTLMDPEAKPVSLDLPARTGVGGSRNDLHVQQTSPETASAVGIVSGKLDQRHGHRPEYAH
jgi:hypothetical protein